MWLILMLVPCCLPFTYYAPPKLLRKPTFEISARKIQIFFKNRRSTSKMKKMPWPFLGLKIFPSRVTKSKCISRDRPFKEKNEEEDEISFKMKTMVSVSVRHLKPERNVSVQ